MVRHGNTKVTNVLSRLYRQRRRLAITGIAAMLAAALLPASAVPPLLAAGVAVAAASAVILLAPDLRRWCECAGLAAVPAALALSLTGLPWLLTLPATAALAVLVRLGLYGPALSRLPLRFAVISTRQHQVMMPAAEVWTRLVPGAGHPDDHWSGTLVDFDVDPDDPDTLYLRHRRPGGALVDQSVTFLDRTDGLSCRYYQETDDAAGHEDAVVSFHLTEVGLDACNIQSEMAQQDLSFGRALSRWLDDVLGDELDSFAALVEARRDWSISGLPRLRARQPDLAPEPDSP